MTVEQEKSENEKERRETEQRGHEQAQEIRQSDATGTNEGI